MNNYFANASENEFVELDNDYIYSPDGAILDSRRQLSSHTTTGASSTATTTTTPAGTSNPATTTTTVAKPDAENTAMKGKWGDKTNCKIDPITKL